MPQHRKLSGYTRAWLDAMKPQQRGWEFDQLVRFTPRNPDSSKARVWPFPPLNVTGPRQSGHARSRPNTVGQTWPGLYKADPSETGGQVEHLRVLPSGGKGFRFPAHHMLRAGIVTVTVTFACMITILVFNQLLGSR